MSNLRFRRLEQHRTGGTSDSMELSMPMPKTPSGKVYNYSPNPDATPRLFLLGNAPDVRSVAEEHQHRIRRQPGPGETVCPYSGLIASDEQFVHFDDVEALKRQVMWAAQEDVGDYLENWARDFNRGQPKGGFISMSMSVKRSRRARPFTIREDLLRDLECDICQRAYGVYAIALFCPDCGAPNIALHFTREVHLVREQIALADQLEAESRRELAYRILGNAHEDVLTAFETALKTVFRYLVCQRLPDETETLCGKMPIGNAFQNIGKGRSLFVSLGIDPFAGLTESDLSTLTLNIQKRHVIGHNLGIADERYSELTQDEQPGETVTLIGDEIAQFAQISLSVVAALEEQLLAENESTIGPPAAV